MRFQILRARLDTGRKQTSIFSNLSLRTWIARIWEKFSACSDARPENLKLHLKPNFRLCFKDVFSEFLRDLHRPNGNTVALTQRACAGISTHLNGNSLERNRFGIKLTPGRRSARSSQKLSLTTLYKLVLWTLAANLLHWMAGSSRSFAAIRKEAGLFCGSFLRNGEVFAYDRGANDLNDLKKRPDHRCWPNQHWNVE